MKNELERIRDQLKCSLNMVGLKGSAEWAVGELDRLAGMRDDYEAMQARVFFLENAIRGWAEAMQFSDLSVEAGYGEEMKSVLASPAVKAEQARYSIKELQKEALNAGLQYVRESDDHYVTGTAEQALDFIRNMIGVDIRLTGKAPSLPAAGSAVEDGPDITTKHGYPAYSVAQHERIVAAQQSAQNPVRCALCGKSILDCDKSGCFGLESEAQQSAPERVSSMSVGVPDELREARVVGFKPGMGEVTLYVGRLPTWLDIGHTCYVSAAPSLPDAGSAELPEPDFTLDAGSQPCYYAETVQRIVAAFSTQQSAHVSVPECVVSWYEAKNAHVEAVDAYNARLSFIREHMPFGASPDPEYQIMEAADRKARELNQAMFVELRALLASHQRGEV